MLNASFYVRFDVVVSGGYQKTSTTTRSGIQESSFALELDGKGQKEKEKDSISRTECLVEMRWEQRVGKWDVRSVPVGVKGI